MDTKELNREEAIEADIIEPIQCRADEYLFHGKPWKIHPDETIPIEVLEGKERGELERMSKEADDE